MDYKQELTSLLENVRDWEALKTKLEKSYNTSVQNDGKKSTLAGKIFECFTKYYFICNSLYQNEFKNVWLFDEIPYDIKKNLNIDHVDHGIDLLLQDKKDSFIAVQCKFKNDENSKLGWSKDKLGNLFGFASSIEKLIIFSNASEIDDVSKTRTSNLIFLSIKDLLELDNIFFSNLREYLLENKKPAYKRFEPFDYQKVIIDTVSDYFKNNDRGKLILPCGTGKTLISLWIKEQMKANLTLFLVPSLNLIRQTKNEWIKNSSTPFDYIIVCSELDIDNEQDSSNLKLYDLDSFVTDDSNDIKDFIKEESSNPKLIFSTYQSFKKIIDSYDEKLQAIDLAICDESHRTASLDIGQFSLIHKDTEKMKIKKRLYMTATPRVYSRTIKKNIEESGCILFDMSDETIYGQEIYRMSFAKAIDLGILVDYQIICMGVEDKNIYDLLKDNIYIDSNTTVTDYVNNYAVKVAFEKHSITHAISFHSKVKQAQLFAERNVDISPNIKSYFVSGNQTASKRSVILNAFKSADKAIVSNARCLTEGVDIPSVDAVFFCDPKNSKIDIVQAVGRTLRKDKNHKNKIGKIIIPLYFSKESNIEEEINSSIYTNVIKIIRSIADQDERLQDEINNLAYKESSIFSNNSRIRFYCDESNKLNDLLSFENVSKKIESALFDEIISKNCITWDLYYKELQDYLNSHNNIYPKQQDNMKLYVFCSQQRIAYQKKDLSNERIKKMEELNFSWDILSDQWNTTFDNLVNFLKNNNGKYPRFRNTTGLEHSLAIWLMKINKEYKDGKLKKERYEKLISINYAFENQNWRQLYEIAKQKTIELGHFPTYKEDLNIYYWLLNQAKKYNSNKLSIEQKCLLNEINITSFNYGEEDWEQRFLYLKDYHKQNGKLPAPKEKFGFKRKITFGSWATKQRIDYQNGKLSNERQSKLESIGFALDTKAEADKSWDEKFTILIQWLDQHNGKYPSNFYSSDEIEKMLTGFVLYNRNWYNGKLKNYGEYPIERKQKLDSILFEWAPNEINKKWNEKFEEAKKQIETFGRIPYKIDEKVNPVYTWIINQKNYFKSNKLTTGKVKKLKEIGIIL